MTFSDYISDIFVPLFTKVGQWFVMLYQEVGLYELFLATIALTLCFNIIIMPFFGYGGAMMIHSGMARSESRRHRRASGGSGGVSSGGSSSSMDLDEFDKWSLGL